MTTATHQFQVGDRVIGPRGPGEIVGMNGVEPSSYTEKLFSSEGKAMLEDVPSIAVGPALAQIVYASDRFPYVVKFDDGYQDVYRNIELKPEHKEV